MVARVCRTMRSSVPWRRSSFDSATHALLWNDHREYATPDVGCQQERETGSAWAAHDRRPARTRPPRATHRAEEPGRTRDLGRVVRGVRAVPPGVLLRGADPVGQAWMAVQERLDPRVDVILLYG